MDVRIVMAQRGNDYNALPEDILDHSSHDATDENRYNAAAKNGDAIAVASGRERIASALYSAQLVTLFDAANMIRCEQIMKRDDILNGGDSKSAQNVPNVPIRVKGVNGGLQSIDMSQQHHVVAHNMYNPYLWTHYVIDPECYMAAAIGEPNAAMLRVHAMSCKECPECMIPVYDAVTKRHCFCNFLNRAAVRLCTTTMGPITCFVLYRHRRSTYERQPLTTFQ